MPQFSIIYDNLKEIGKESDEELKKLKQAAKSQRKPVVDMGIPPPKKGEEKQARAGATFDPKNFKGNA